MHSQLLLSSGALLTNLNYGKQKIFFTIVIHAKYFRNQWKCTCSIYQHIQRYFQYLDEFVHIFDPSNFSISLSKRYPAALYLSAQQLHTANHIHLFCLSNLYKLNCHLMNCGLLYWWLCHMDSAIS